MRIREGDPLEIYTDKEGGVIFKKYSPIGEMADFAAQYAETLNKTCGLSVLISDRDSVIAAAGVPRKEYSEKRISREMESVIQSRAFYSEYTGEAISAIEGGSLSVRCAMPIIAAGDIAGCVISLAAAGDKQLDREVEAKLIMTAAGFLARQLE